MLNIKKTRAANFRSIGNQPLEFDFTQSRTTLVTADKNGSGKSTLVLHSIVYAFYNKSYDDGTKLPDLVNSTNKKKCLVEVDFDAKGSSWMVRRGQKPAVFQLFKDDKEVLEDKHNDEKQEYLEALLGIDFKNFCFTVALGKDRFVPFISMKAAERRLAVDAIWDLVIFSKMQTLAKKSVSELKKDLDSLMSDKRVYERDLEHSKNLYSELKQAAEVSTSYWQSKKDSVEAEITALEGSLKSKLEVASQLKQNVELNNERARKHGIMSAGVQQLQAEIDRLGTSIRMREDNCTCAECGQELPKIERHKILSKLRDDLSLVQNKLKRAKELLDGLMYCSEVAAELQADYTTIQTDMRVIASNISSKRLELSEIDSQLSKSVDNSKLYKAQEDIQKALDSIAQCSQDYAATQKKLDQYNNTVTLLSDNGIKQELIEAYIPKLNVLTNDYLNILGLPVTIDITSSFDVEIVSPNKKGLPIHSLSTGQKCRIDLALLFAFRDIAVGQSTMACNVLILDETLESLSEAGAIAFSDLCKAKLDHMNVVVISQRSAEFEVLFERTVTFDTLDDFTIIQ